jgi:hypothetical protein
MTAGAAGRRLTPPPAVLSTSTLSLMTSPAIDASAESQSRGGRSHHKAGGQKSAAPLIFSGVGLAGCGFLQLGGARPAGRHKRPDRPLVLSGRVSCLMRARAHSLVACGHLRLSR